MNNEPKKASKWKTVLIVLLVLAGIPALFIVVYKVGAAEVSGTLEMNGGESGDWTVAVDECHTSYDFIPDYKGVQFDSGERPGYHLRVLRDVKSKLMSQQSIEIAHGPNEDLTEADRAGLSQYAADRWAIHLLTPQRRTPIRIDPEMCSRFGLEVEIEVTKQRSSGGSLDLVCTLSDGGQLTVQIDATGCM